MINKSVLKSISKELSQPVLDLNSIIDAKMEEAILFLVNKAFYEGCVFGATEIITKCCEQGFELKEDIETDFMRFYTLDDTKGGDNEI